MQSAQNSSCDVVSAMYTLFVTMTMMITTSVSICTFPFSVGEIETRNCNNSFELYNAYYNFLF